MEVKVEAGLGERVGRIGGHWGTDERWGRTMEAALASGAKGGAGAERGWKEGEGNGNF